jgi:hypothetical protein
VWSTCPELLRRTVVLLAFGRRASHDLRRFWPALFAFAMVVLGRALADLNPAALQYKLPNQIEWKDTPIGAKMAIMHGDPDKAGPYIVLITPSDEPAAFSPQRPVHHGAVRDLVGRYREQVRS